MPTIVGVKLRYASKVLSFDPASTTPQVGDLVIVKTEKGTEAGEVVEAAHEVAKSDLRGPLKPVLRKANDKDVEHISELAELEKAAMPVFRETLGKHKLDMKPIAVQYLFDDNKAIFYFSAEDRVDFRELVRDLASLFKIRVDMRQVGVRDEARMVGGIGHCGQMLCCARMSGDFQPVSIRMAKEQDLPLNPLKISGLCGRLMCCLRYEYDAYKDFKGRAPKRNAKVETPIGLAKVVELNTPRETVKLRLEDGTPMTVPLSTMECGCGSGCPCSLKQEALDEAGVVLPTMPALVSEAKARSSQGKKAESGRSGDRNKRGSGPSKPKQDSGRRKSKGGGKRPPQAKQSSDEKTKNDAKQQGAAKTDGDKPASSSGRRRRRRRRPSGGEKKSE